MESPPRFCLSRVLPRPPAVTTPPEPPLALADLERLAIEKNPTLEQAAAESRRGAARSRLDCSQPGDRVCRGRIPYRGGEGRGKNGLFVEQTIPLGGRLRLSREVFAKEVAEAEANLEAQRLRVVNSVRSLYYEELIAARRVEVRTRLAELSDEPWTSRASS